MKKKKVILLLLSYLMTVGVMAEDDDYTMNVNLTDGGQVQFVLSGQPSVLCVDGQMIIYYGKWSKGQTSVEGNGQVFVSEVERDELSFERNQVKDLTFGMTSNIEDVKTDANRINFNLTHRSIVEISGLMADDNLQVFSLDGKNVQVPINRISDRATIDLRTMPCGSYIISVNKRFTFKLMKQ